MTDQRRAVIVYGANGKIGGLVAATLNAAGFSVVVAGRRQSALRSVARSLGRPFATIGLAEAASLVRLASRGWLLVNCAGPYAETGRPVLDACLHAGTHYLDVCGESRVVAAAFAHRDAVARSRGVVVCPAMGAKGALGDWAIALLHRRRGSEAFDLAYAHEGRAYWNPSLAALLSVAYEGVAWEAVRPVDHGPPPRAFSFPPPMRDGYAVHVSGTEQVTTAWQRPARVRSYLSVDPGTSANAAWSAIHEPAFGWLTQPTAPRLWRELLRPSGRAALRQRLGPPGRGAMSLVVEARDRGLAVHVEDPYAATAAIVLEAAIALRGAARRPGVRAPSQVLDPASALRGLQARGLAQLFTGGRTR